MIKASCKGWCMVKGFIALPEALPWPDEPNRATGPENGYIFTPCRPRFVVAQVCIYHGLHKLS